MQRAVQSSIASGKSEQISRDAAPEVVHDGSFERTFDPEEVRRALHS